MKRMIFWGYMEKIKFTDIDFSVLYRLEQQGSNATLYRKGQTCIKILDKYQVEERDKLYRKLLEVVNIKIMTLHLFLC